MVSSKSEQIRVHLSYLAYVILVILLITLLAPPAETVASATRPVSNVGTQVVAIADEPGVPLTNPLPAQGPLVTPSDYWRSLRLPDSFGLSPCVALSNQVYQQTERIAIMNEKLDTVTDRLESLSLEDGQPRAAGLHSRNVTTGGLLILGLLIFMGYQYVQIGRFENEA